MENKGITETNTAPRKVLFIDDEHDFETVVRQRFRKLVRAGKLEILFAYNGQEGLNTLEKHPDIGIVFTDINMPGMDGITFLQKLEEDPWKKRMLRVIVVSAYGDMKNIRHAMNSGAFDFLNKPVEFDDLEATLEKAAVELDKLVEGQQAAQQLETVLREKLLAEASEKLKEDFFANITHELRTPLTLIMGPVDQLLTTTQEGGTREKLTTVRNNSRRLLRLINRLLDLSRVESGNMQLNLARTNLTELLQEVYAAFAELARQKKIELAIQQAPEALFADIDPEKIMQVMFNLLSNALKFTPEGGRVILMLRENANLTFTISVRDSGVGIPETELPKVFERFFRIEGRPGKGTGIGLALSQELVRLHGGSMDVRSIEGFGSEFFFTVPVVENIKEEFDLKSLHLAAEADFSLLEEDEAEELETAAEGQLSILVVEDNAEMRKLIQGYLEGEYHLLMAENGARGLEIASETVPDLIVSDVNMPEMDGYEFSERLKLHEATSHVPVILLTARASLDDKITGLETGADDYLVKPFDGRELQSRIRNLLAGRVRLREHFRNQFLTSPGEVVAQSREETFLLRIKSSVDAHLSDELFGVEALCAEIGMSRTQVHRKLTALTGNSTSYFIRTYRLETAMQMLRRDTGTISEIAYDVGFSSPSYFAKCFSDHFKMTPREARKRG